MLGEFRLWSVGCKEAPKVLIRRMTCSKRCLEKINLPAVSYKASAHVQGIHARMRCDDTCKEVKWCLAQNKQEPHFCCSVYS